MVALSLCPGALPLHLAPTCPQAPCVQQYFVMSVQKRPPLSGVFSGTTLRLIAIIIVVVVVCGCCDACFHILLNLLNKLEDLELDGFIGCGVHHVC